ncbi:MAG: hypothetical protein QXE01_03920 [Sulfolobales archaeon]
MRIQRLLGVAEAVVALIMVLLVAVAFTIAYLLISGSIYVTSGSIFYLEVIASGTPSGSAATFSIKVRNVGDTPVYIGSLYIMPASTSQSISMSWYRSSDNSVSVYIGQPGSSPQCGSRLLSPGQFLEATIEIIGSGWVRGTQVIVVFVACNPAGAPVSQSARVVL